MRNDWIAVNSVLSVLLTLSWHLLTLCSTHFPIWVRLTVFRGPQSLEPSQGISPLLRDFHVSTEFSRIWLMNDDWCKKVTVLAFLLAVSTTWPYYLIYHFSSIVILWLTSLSWVGLTVWQAFRKHKLFDPLTEPGTADLTADVDFKYIANCVADKGRPVYIVI